MRLAPRRRRRDYDHLGHSARHASPVFEIQTVIAYLRSDVRTPLYGNGMQLRNIDAAVTAE